MAGYCRKCGAALVHLENPDRDACTADHSQLPENRARAETARKTAGKRRGQKRTREQRRTMSQAAQERENKKKGKQPPGA